MISKLAYVHPDAKIGNNVTIEPFAYIAGDVVIGDDCWIGPSAAIYDGARIGKGCKNPHGRIDSMHAAGHEVQGRGHHSRNRRL